MFITVVVSSFSLKGQDTLCKQQDLGKIEFKKNSSKLTANAKLKLDSVSSMIKRQQTCDILVTCYSADYCDKCGVLSWDRQKAVIKYLIKNGIAEKKLKTLTVLEGSADFLTLTLSSWPLPDQPAQHPK